MKVRKVCRGMIFASPWTMRVALLPLLLPLLFCCGLPRQAHAQEDNPLPWVERPIPWDTAPRFPGGDQAWQRYLVDSLRYPPEARKVGLQGDVLATLQVDSLGRITEVRIVNGVPGAPAMARETERFLLTMPPWRPATKGGRPVPAEVHLAIPFRPQDGR